MVLNTRKRNRVKFNSGLSANPPSNNWALGTRLYFYYIIQPDSVIIRFDDVKVLKSRWNFVKTETTTPGNNIYTLLITFIAFTSFISSKFQTLFFPYKLSYYATGWPYYAWATCGGRRGRLYTQAMKLLPRKTWFRYFFRNKILNITIFPKYHEIF